MSLRVRNILLALVLVCVVVALYVAFIFEMLGR